MDDLPPSLDQSISLTVGHSPVFDQKGDGQRHRPRYSSETVDHDVGPLQTLMDKPCSLLEVLADIKSLMIFSRDIEEVRNLSTRMIDFYSLSSGQQCTDLEFFNKGDGYS